jgi:hypothetical protein
MLKSNVLGFFSYVVPSVNFIRKYGFLVFYDEN